MYKIKIVGFETPKFGPGGETTDGCPANFYKNAQGKCVPEYKPNASSDVERQFITNWNNSPMSQQMLQASVDKDDPWGRNSVYVKDITNARNTLTNKAQIKLLSQDQLIKEHNLQPGASPAGPSLGGFAATEINRPKAIGSGFLNMVTTPLIANVIGNNKAYSNIDFNNINNIQPKIYTNKDNLDQILETNLHELSHASDFNGQLIPDSDVKKMNIFARGIKGAPSPVLDKFQQYVAGPTETRARLMNFRYNAANQKLYDPFKEKINLDQLKNYKSTPGGFDPLEQLKMVYSDEEILNLLNSVSKTDNTQPQTMAAYGGPMVDYMSGKMNHGEMFKQGGVASNQGYYNKGMGVPRFDEGGAPCPPGFHWNPMFKTCDPDATRGDSILISQNAIDKNNFYEGNPDYKTNKYKNRGKNITSSSLNNLVNESKNIHKLYKDWQVWDKQLPDIPSPKKYPINRKKIYERTGKVKGSNSVYMAPDILDGQVDSYFNPDAPPVYFSPSILPQGTKYYQSTEAHGFNDETNAPYYDPIAVTPFDMLTPEQQKIRIEKYGTQGTPTVISKATPPQGGHQGGTPIYGPGNSLVGVVDNDKFYPATGDQAKGMNTPDTTLMQDPAAFQKYIDQKVGRGVGYAKIQPSMKNGGTPRFQGGGNTDPFGVYNTLHKKGDFSNPRQSVINTMSNLPIYSPDVRYQEYKTMLPEWKAAVENVPIETGKKSPHAGSSYYGYGAPSFSPEFAFQGSVQLDPNQFDNLQTPDRVISHELRHAGFDGSRYIPQSYGDALYTTARHPEGFERGAHQDMIQERAAMNLGTRQAMLERFGLPSNAKIPRKLFDTYNRETMETSLRQGHPIDQFSDVDETFKGARNASDVYDLVNFNIPKEKNGGDISIPQLPKANSPLLQFYYGKLGGQTTRNLMDSMVKPQKKRKLD